MWARPLVTGTRVTYILTAMLRPYARAYGLGMAHGYITTAGSINTGATVVIGPIAIVGTTVLVMCPMAQGP